MDINKMPMSMRGESMTTEGYIIGACECQTCGLEYDFEATGAELSDQCPDCAAREEAEARAEDEREEAISDAQGAIDEAEADLEGMMEELRELRERIAATRRSLAAARRRLARLEAGASMLG
jgi:chromosome segregation ATPase